MDLQELRKKIDGIDSRIVELYEERMDVCRQVAEYKIETGKNVFDKVREEEKLARVRAMTHNDFNSKGITELFEQIMSMSRKLQYQLLNEKGRTGRLPFFPVEDLDTQKVRVVFQGAGILRCFRLKIPRRALSARFTTFWWSLKIIS